MGISINISSYISTHRLSYLPCRKTMKIKSKAEIKAKKQRINEKLKARILKPKVIKHNIPALTEACDNLFALWIRLVRDKDKWCITCWNTTREMNCWHFQVRQHFATRFSEMNCAKQCTYCNKEFSGEQVKFGRRIDEIYWKGTAEALEILANGVYKRTQEELLRIYNHYYNELIKEKIYIPKSYIVKKYLWNN